MRFLIDTNIIIPLEPASTGDLEPGTETAARFIALAHDQNFGVVVHPDARIDIARDQDDDRRKLRDRLLDKYPELVHPPPVHLVEDVVGPAEPHSNDWVDHRLLAAVLADAVDYLVTQDGRLRRKAARLGLADRVLTVEDALALVESLVEQLPARLPLLDFVPLHTVPSTDPILNSIRDDYPGFDTWLANAKREGRSAYVIRDPDDACAALCILKPDDDEYHLGGRVLKLCTFKVAEQRAGNRYGELLLKGVFRYCVDNAYDGTWVTVFDRHQNLIALLEQFGFAHRMTNDAGERVMAKELRPRPDADELDPLDHHIRYGPPALRPTPETTLVVPIRPEYHRLLFPELEPQLQLLQADPRPFGNAIRKAYLSNGAIRHIPAGSTMLFYRSTDMKAITTIGVVEDVLISADADEVARFVGARTVYSYEDIRRMAKTHVVAILFRQDRPIRNPVALRELLAHSVLGGHPQTICHTKKGAHEWLMSRIDA